MSLFMTGVIAISPNTASHSGGVIASLPRFGLNVISLK